MALVSLRSRIYSLGTGDPVEHITGTKESGPAGIEAIIEYNGLYLNVRDWIDTFLVTNIEGIDDADIRDLRENNPGQHGETPGPAFYGGRTIVLQGKIQTKTLWKMRDMSLALRGAFADISQEKPLIFHGETVESDLLCYCKKSQKLSIPEAQTTQNGFERTFNITLRASNPRFVSSVWDYQVWEYTGAAAFDGIAFNTVNKGNFETQPTIELTGPMTSPQLYNELNENVILFNTVIPAGETWVIDMKVPRVYRKSDFADRFNFVDETSTDLLYDPEFPNPIRFTATGLTAASKIESFGQHTVM